MTNNTIINDCLADLVDNYDRDVLIGYANDDDGAYTIMGHGTSFDVDVIADALALFLTTL